MPCLIPLMRKISLRKGFTLVELLLVTVLLSVIGAAVYAAFSSGVNLWQRINAEMRVEDINLFFDKVARDLRSTFYFTAIRLQGTASRISFPAVVSLRTEEGVKQQPGQISYQFNTQYRRLERKEADYSQVYRGKGGLEHALLDDIQSFHVQYYYYEPEQEEYLWTQAWPIQEGTFGQETEPTLPLAVRMTIGIKDGNTKRQFTKTVLIPAACCFVQSAR